MKQQHDWIRSSLTRFLIGARECARRRSLAVLIGTSFGIACAMLLEPAVSIGQSALPSTQLTLQPGQSATRLSDGRILLLGGVQASAAAQLFDPSTGRRTNVSNSLHYARAGHTATALPDGTVLVVGGIGSNGTTVNINELYDPTSGQFVELPGYWSAPRAYHTTTLLTDGRLLIAGGRDDSSHAIAIAELWKSDTASLWGAGVASTAKSPISMLSARTGASATLLSDGSVLIDGGQASAVASERFNPTTERFESSAASSVEADDRTSAPHLVGSLPENGASAVALDERIALRFSGQLHVDELSSQDARLTGPRGPETVRVTMAEGGRLVFLNPLSPLQAGARYTVEIQTATSTAPRSSSPTTLSFNTIPLPTTEHREVQSAIASLQTQLRAVSNVAPNAQDPTPASTSDNPTAKVQPTHPSQLPPRQAPPGVTALSGTVLLQDGRPLAHVTLSVEGISAKTDGTGRFLLQRIPTGHQELIIDGRSASKPHSVYGLFEAGIDIVGFETNVLPYTIWMPELDASAAVPISSPTSNEVVITTPRIPGLELHLPANTTIIDHDGNVARQIGITAIPVDKPPFPLPANAEVPVYFTIQQGAAYVQNSTHAKAWLVYPNYKNQPPGTRVNFWHYDPEEEGWYVYGQGTVTDDGRQVKPDPGVGIYEFTGAMISSSPAPPVTFAPPGGCSWAADPVDCSTGLFVHQVTDLFLADTLPLSLRRTYRTQDTTSRPFGVGANHSYGMYLYSTQNYTAADLILPDGGRIHYVRTSPGTSYSDAVYEHIETPTTSATPTEFYKSKLAWNGSGWDLTLKSGLTYIFGDMAPLQAIRDRNGNRIQLLWSTINAYGAGSGNLLRVTSPNGRWIAFTYDTAGRITQAQDNLGRSVGYAYSAAGDLSSVTDANGKVTSYTYDASHRMLTWTDPRSNVVVANQYDATTGRVMQQTYPDSTTNLFAYTTNAGKITRTEVTDERGHVRRFDFNADGYVTAETNALGTNVEQTTSFTRQAGSNLVLSVTDSIGHRTDFTYDTRGNVTSVTRLAEASSPLTTAYTYSNAFDSVTSITDPLNHTTTMAYDGRGNLTTVTDALNHTTTRTYNLAGQPTAVTDPLSHTAALTYVRGDLVTIQNPLGHVFTRRTDAAGRVVAVIDELGNTTRYQYDGRDRLTQISDAKGGVTGLTYDDNGNLLSVTDPRGGTLSYTYDPRNRPITRVDALLQTESYEFDPVGNVIQRTQRNGKISTFTYDAQNRPIEGKFGRTLQGQSLSAPDATVTIAWDADNRLTQLTDTQGGTISRSYDDANRTVSESTAQGSITYTFDAAYRRATSTIAGQSQVSYGYDAADRLTSLSQGSTTVAVTYDNADRRSTITLPNGVVAQYSYDSADQLSGIQYLSGASTLGDLTYSYDAAGRRIKRGGTLSSVDLPSAVSSATYDANQRLLAWGTRSLGYDTDGNLTSDGTNAYTWDSRDRLISATGATFGYDGMGRRTSKSQSGTMVSYMYDDQNVAQELDAGGVFSNILNGLAVDERFSRTDSAGRRTYLTDALGSTLALADDAGVVQTTYAYQPYGLTSFAGTASSNSNQFTGRENDGAELYLYRARYYNATLGRFISEDPRGIAGGLNLYEYALSNPIRYTDPLGEEPKGPPARGGNWKKGPRFKCPECGAKQGWGPGGYCWDCEGKSRDPKGGVPPNPHGAHPWGDGGADQDKPDDANRMFDPFARAHQYGFILYFILFPCW